MKKTLTALHIKIMNFLHRPFIRSRADPYHAIFNEFVVLSRQSISPSILEIGSRNVTGVTRREIFSNCSNYVGFDVLAGRGVDIVGDAHKLSESFKVDRFDFVYSISVFEHLLFPWKAVLEINKVLKPGGHVFLSTHPAWPAHEMPWDFWRLPANGFHALFNKVTGFEIISLSEGLPARMYSLSPDPPTQTNCFHTMHQGVSLLARKTGNYRADLLKWDIEISDVLDTMYPANHRKDSNIS